MKKILLTIISIYFLVFAGILIAGPKGKCIEGNCTNGTGTKVWPDGKRYQGEWKYGKRNGKGKMTLPSGKVKEGRWRNGKYIGK